VAKQQFYNADRFYTQARVDSFTRRLVLKSFEATGIFPLNPRRVNIAKTAPVRGHEKGTLVIEPPPLALAAASLDPSNTEGPTISRDFKVLKDIQDALRIVPKSAQERRLLNALKGSLDVVVAANAREIVTADQAQKIEDAAARRKDGKRRKLQLGGKVITNEETWQQIEARELAAREKENKKGTPKRGSAKAVKMTTLKKRTGRRQPLAPIDEDSNEDSEVDFENLDLSNANGRDGPAETTDNPEDIRHPQPRPHKRNAASHSEAVQGVAKESPAVADAEEVQLVTCRRRPRPRPRPRVQQTPAADSDKRPSSEQRRPNAGTSGDAEIIGLGIDEVLRPSRGRQMRTRQQDRDKEEEGGSSEPDLVLAPIVLRSGRKTTAIRRKD